MWEAEIGRISVPSQKPRQKKKKKKNHETPSQRKGIMDLSSHLKQEV
jgi:hypothetical protein